MCKASHLYIHFVNLLFFGFEICLSCDNLISSPKCSTRPWDETLKPWSKQFQGGRWGCRTPEIRGDLGYTGIPSFTLLYRYCVFTN